MSRSPLRSEERLAIVTSKNPIRLLASGTISAMASEVSAFSGERCSANFRLRSRFGEAVKRVLAAEELLEERALVARERIELQAPC